MAKIDDFFNRLYNEQQIFETQLERFHSKFGNSFSEIVEKVCLKYESDKYVDHWYKQSIEPPCPLYWFLLEYAKKYGRECTESELERYGNMFTTELVYCKGYYFGRMDGQGSVVQIHSEGGVVKS
jgi:hypothetical protein